MDGSRRPINEYQTCNWGMAPTDAIVTTSAKSSATRLMYQNWLHVSITFCLDFCISLLSM